MKKTALLALVLMLVLTLSLSVFADAEFTVTESNLIIYDDDDDGYFFARIKNTGDMPGYYGSGVLEILDGNNNAFITKNYVGSSPYGILLQPGESAYIRESIWDKQLIETRPSGYSYTPTVKTYGSKYYQVPCDAQFYYSEDSKYDNDIFITFTNSTDELLHDFSFVASIYDQNDTLVYVYSTSYSNIGLYPGSTITMMFDIYSNMCQYYINHGITPTRIEGYVYISGD